MRFNTVLIAATLIIGSSHLASAADSCEAQAKALTPTISTLTDATKKEKASRLQEKAIDEATTEGDEDECLDYLKDLKGLLGVQ